MINALAAIASASVVCSTDFHVVTLPWPPSNYFTKLHMGLTDSLRRLSQQQRLNERSKP
jgi:hypothetical protein